MDKQNKEDFRRSFSTENTFEFDSIKRKQKVKWTCDLGHTWIATLQDRIDSSSGCHICSGYVNQKKCEYNDDRTQKRCNNCNHMKDVASFRTRRRGGNWLNSVCRICEQNNVLHYRTMTPEGVVAEILRRKKHLCKKENLPFDLTKDYLLERLVKIDWKCELTRLPMRSVKSNIDEKYQGFQLDSISLDRIKHDGGYTKDNVRFVLNQVNIFRSNGDDDRMYKIAEALVANRKVAQNEI
jgi:hypothetical protein